MAKHGGTIESRVFFPFARWAFIALGILALLSLLIAAGSLAFKAFGASIRGSVYVSPNTIQEELQPFGRRTLSPGSRPNENSSSPSTVNEMVSRMYPNTEISKLVTLLFGTDPSIGQVQEVIERIEDALDLNDDSRSYIRNAIEVMEAVEAPRRAPALELYHSTRTIELLNRQRQKVKSDIERYTAMATMISSAMILLMVALVLALLAIERNTRIGKKSTKKQELRSDSEDSRLG